MHSSYLLKFQPQFHQKHSFKTLDFGNLSVCSPVSFSTAWCFPWVLCMLPYFCLFLVIIFIRQKFYLQIISKINLGLEWYDLPLDRIYICCYQDHLIQISETEILWSCATIHARTRALPAHSQSCCAGFYGFNPSEGFHSWFPFGSWTPIPIPLMLKGYQNVSVPTCPFGNRQMPSGESSFQVRLTFSGLCSFPSPDPVILCYCICPLVPWSIFY